MRASPNRRLAAASRSRRQLLPREPRQVLRATHEVVDENDQSNNYKDPNESIARSGDGKRHVSSFVVCRLSVSVSSLGLNAPRKRSSRLGSAIGSALQSRISILGCSTIPVISRIRVLASAG